MTRPRITPGVVIALLLAAAAIIPTAAAVASGDLNEPACGLGQACP